MTEVSNLFLLVSLQMRILIQILYAVADRNNATINKMRRIWERDLKQNRLTKERHEQEIGRRIPKSFEALQMIREPIFNPNWDFGDWRLGRRKANCKNCKDKTQYVRSLSWLLSASVYFILCFVSISVLFCIGLKLEAAEHHFNSRATTKLTIILSVHSL